MSLQPPPQGQPESKGPRGPARMKKGALPWLLAGTGLLVFALIAGVALGVAGSSSGVNSRPVAGSDAKAATSAGTFGFGSRGRAPMVDSATAMASFQYPEGWVQGGEEFTTVNSDGTVPAEEFVALNRFLDGTALLSYTAEKPLVQQPTQQQIHEILDLGLRSQLQLPQDRLVEQRSTSGFGCVQDFAYTERPSILERDHMYGFRYGYGCMTISGPIQGEYLVAIDDTGVLHTFIVEALQFEWDASRESMTAIIDSFKPRL